MMRYFLRSIFVICLFFRIYFYLDDYCTSDLCRHAFQLSVEADELRIEVLPFVLRNTSDFLFYFIDLLLIYPAFILINDVFLALLFFGWFVQPSYDSWALVPISYIFKYPAHYRFFSVFALFLKFKIVLLAFFSYYISSFARVRRKIVLSRFLLILILFVVISLYILNQNLGLQADETNLVGYDNFLFRFIVYLLSPFSALFAVLNDLELYSNVIRYQNLFISIFSFICIFKYRLVFYYFLIAILTSAVVDFVQIRYFLYLLTVAFVLQYLFFHSPLTRYSSKLS